MTDTASELRSTASALVAKGKGILAADESDGTIAKRFSSLGISNTEENRRNYRELLFTTSQVDQFISGVILYDETIRQTSSDGIPFAQLLKERGIIPGIKVDKGAKQLAGSPSEKVTEGLDGLRERLSEYRDMGARFTKWRAVIAIGDRIPTRYCIDTNAHALGRYAALSQEAGLVPIVEPEVLIDGEHTIERCEEVTTLVLHQTFDELFSQKVMFEGMLLKPNMVLSGKDSPEQAPVDEVAQRTLRCFRRTVPAAVPGVVFLSGGQSDELATARLNAMNVMGDTPWEVGFSYSRALQGPAMKAWAGNAANAEAAQEAFYVRAKLNSAARLGAYSDEMERVPA
jgi:fructose-bisphosphate aldolase, class I